MKVLVTSAKGQVGSELIQQGYRPGIQMLALGHAELDITQQNTVHSSIQTEQPDIIINEAAYTAVDQAESEPELAYAINRDGASYLTQACANNNIPLLHLSTNYLFEGSKERPYSETDTPNPQGIYGKSKLEGDLAVESILKQYLILLVSWVFLGHRVITL